MQVITDLNQLPKPNPPLVLTMGDFDGIHIGHRALLERTIEQAQKLSLTPAILTFDPSPKKILEKLPQDEYILTALEKQMILKILGIQLAIFLPFTLTIAQFSARRYLQEILLAKLNMKWLVIGYDHHFGRNRRGNFHYLKLAAPRYSFTVEQLEPVKANGQIVSSSLIRQALDKGNMTEANQMLSFPYFIHSVVLPGKQRGQHLGFPTANLQLVGEKKLPKVGVYFGAALLEKQLHRAVINVGYKPTFENQTLTVEAHLPGFSGNLYHKKITLFFLKYLREEIKFPNLESLKKQIALDIAYSNQLSLPENLKIFA